MRTDAPLEPAMLAIELGAEVKIFKKKGPYLRLRLQKRTGLFHALVPEQMSEERVQAFLHSKKEWIQKTRLAWEAQRQMHSYSQNIFQTIWLWGKERKIEWIGHEGFFKTLLSENRLQLFFSEYQKREWLLQHYLEQQLWAAIAQWEKQWTSRIGVAPKQIKLADGVSSWGSCHPHQNKIVLNKKLVHYPEVCGEYVWVHEMVHLLEPSHNARFHRLMAEFLPDYKDRRKQLRHFPSQAALS